jgi:hypothetical protein
MRITAQAQLHASLNLVRRHVRPRNWQSGSGAGFLPSYFGLYLPVTIPY